MLYYLWGMLATITGAVILFNTIRKRKSIGAISYGTYCFFSVVAVTAGVICMICQRYDELCAILFGIAFSVFTYKDECPPRFTINYINHLKGYFVGFGSILYGVCKLF